MINLSNIHASTHSFQVLQTAVKSQTAVMTLPGGAASGDEPESHPHSDQILLLVSGEVIATLGDERARMKAGDVVIVPAGVKHLFTNECSMPALTFSVYAPPAYPEGTRE